MSDGLSDMARAQRDERWLRQMRDRVEKVLVPRVDEEVSVLRLTYSSMRVRWRDAAGRACAWDVSAPTGDGVRTPVEERLIAAFERMLEADGAFHAARASANAQHVRFRYCNHRGEIADRRVLPMRMWFGATKYHPKPQWLLQGLDLDEGAERDFAMKDISLWRVEREG